MKELSIEKKAKRYDEAIKRLEDVMTGKCQKTFMFTKGLFDYIFPELKKNEENVDDNIRKALIEMVNDTVGDSLWVDYNVHKEDAIAWLEKQCEQKPTKVEQKFKKGDWVTDGVGKCQIRFIDDTQYWYSENCILGSIKSVDKRYRLWTIGDAKDGDVLATLDYILIFKKFLPKDGGVSYCHYDFGCSTPYFNFNEDDNWYFGKEAKVYPATKEQRELLFQKMKEAGYQWDAEKKELKKIEQKPAEWSEEDVREVAILKAYINSRDWSDSHIDRALGIVDELVKKLKSLRPQSTWKPSATDIMALEDVIDRGRNPINYHATLHSILEQLKKLREE